MVREKLSSRRGFTLIELLVVVAIIALLISILLPSLRDAREQAKVAKCLANYRQVTVSAVQYFLDCNDEFPFCGPKQINSNGEISGICTWAFGGATNERPGPNGHYWKNSNNGDFFIPSIDRPFNTYLMGGKLETDIYEGPDLLRRAEVPVLQCPSDRYSNQHRFIVDEGVQPFSSYEDVGTSYQYNFHALSPETRTGLGSGLKYNGTDDPDCFRPPGTWTDYGKILVKQVLAKHSATFVMFIEDPMDWALNQQTQEVGNHGKFGRNPIGFLDGHALYTVTDTRNWCGLGWEAINPEWVQHTGQTGPPRPVSYVDFFTTCDPRVH